MTILVLWKTENQKWGLKKEMEEPQTPPPKEKQKKTSSIPAVIVNAMFTQWHFTANWVAAWESVQCMCSTVIQLMQICSEYMQPSF